MADNPHAQQHPQDHDPAGSTQMFRRFVDDQPSGTRAGTGAPASSGPRIGLIVGVVVAVVAVVALGWLAIG